MSGLLLSDLAAAATAMGVPEALVKRSAEARAKATGASVDEILAAWAGGTAAPAAPAVSSEPPATSHEPAPEEPVAAAPVETRPQTAAATPELETVGSEPPPAGGNRIALSLSSPPVLVGDRQGIGVLVSGSLGLLVLSLLLSVFLPSMQQPGNGIRSSNHAFSTQARDGQQIYSSQGCATCHTQIVRNVVTDVGLGPVTLDDTNQSIGYRRIGPDLSAIGSRIDDTAALIALLSGEGKHPAASGLSETDLANLVAYMRESG